MVRFDSVLEIRELADCVHRPVLLVVVRDGRGIGRTPVDRALRGHAVAGESPASAIVGPRPDPAARCRERHSSGRVSPRREPPTATPLARGGRSRPGASCAIPGAGAMEPLFERCTLCQDPAVDGGGVNGPPRAGLSSSPWRSLPGYATSQRPPGRLIAWPTWAPLTLTMMAPALVSSPAGHQGPIIPEIERQGKFATEPLGVR